MKHDQKNIETLSPYEENLPNTEGGGLEIMRVIEDLDDGCKVYVSLADVMDHAESWGIYLADVARAIARDYDHLESYDNADVLETIRRGFVLAFKKGRGFGGAWTPPSGGRGA